MQCVRLDLSCDTHHPVNKMMKLLLLGCALQLAWGDTLYFRPHGQPPPKNISCPDQTPCPQGNTCCPVTDTQYGCCPYRNAVCCSDGIHCCPRGSTCDTGTSGCVAGDTNHDALEVVTSDSPKPSTDVDISLLCPDHEGMCPGGQTCCMGRNGVYSCCPHKQATCCKDRTHCCPKGFTCDIGNHRCVKRGQGYFMNILNQFLTRTKPQNHKVVRSVQCDTTHSCPDGNTCCKMTGSVWGCCPLPRAVCCSDKTHCCPHGATCSPGTGTCTHGDVSFPWLTKTVATRTDLEDVQCDSAHSCPDGSTCCKLPDGQWGCCPLPNAVCCSDHTHCCPQGTTCDTAQGKCDQQDGTFTPWFEKVVAERKVKDVQCDGTHSCPDGSTCCTLPDGQWGCCPLPNAVCCSDHTHCCPQGTTCNTAQGKCTQQDGTSTPWFEKVAAERNVKDVQCDSTHSCPDGSTCCKLPDGQWGCCPIPNAVCCSDHTHCCPQGTTCDTAQGKCDQQDGTSTPWLEKVAAESNVKDVECDDTHSCPDGNTCCKISGGQWGCCPLPNAVCCSDHTHCCPHGTTCNTAQGKCTQQDGTSTPWLEKVAAENKVKDVQCDGTHSCPDGSACCKLPDGQWGCCPIPNAVCCSDHTHCCPQGTTCNTAQGKCTQQDGTSTPWLEKVAAERKVKDVQCDGTHSCPDGNTCCKMSGGQWGCCPLPKAVCCSDHTHCCPQGTTCDTAQGKCDQQDGTSTPWFEKVAAERKVKDVQCDGTHSCPDGSTCCKLPDGQWGCCPLPNAVCCSDHTHCCPQGTTCNTAQGKCSQQDGTSTPWLEKVAAERKVKDVQCDGTYSCPDGNTCCKMSGGQWGCCPLPDAVCCSDHTHCCPQGTTCDTAQGKCDQQDGTSTPWLEKVAAERKVKDVQCDGTHSCPDGSTCCKMSGGQWGCCPLPKAVCCSDHTHCCPQGTTCDTAQGKCDQQDGTSTPWFEKVAAERKVKDVQCDGTHSCPDGSTCCKLPDGQWGCCPLPNAVCCSDHTHCCPQGTTCDTAQGKCDQQDGTSTPWFEKVAAERKVKDVQCDGTHSCPDGSTCCKMSGGQWGCCPLPNAVCCSDHTHCCPQGTTCDTAQGKCDQQDGTSTPWLEKVAAKKVKDVECDDTYSCPDGSTCCKMSGGQWGCCPLPNAVCCSDHTHCCPQGTTCNTAQGKCDQQDGTSTPWFEKVVAERKVEDVQCDGTYSCPDGSTCCKLLDGQWGCCPLPKAVCCSDHTHCCPQGTTCNTAQGKCTQQDGTSTPWLEKVAAEKKVKDVQCDGTHSCPDGSTCCKMSGGQWGCCPLPNAVCCTDHVHCCPHGSTCDLASRTCNQQGGRSLAWFVKQPAMSKPKNVRCNSTVECPDGNTCCKLKTGDFGCCPLPKAVCCSDGVHCCPQGSKCSTGSCVQSDGSSIPLVQKVPAISRPAGIQITDPLEQSVSLQRHNTLETENTPIVCPNGSLCSSGTTCCKLGHANRYRCCPVPNAVCCSDHLHCCPSNTRCNVARGTCEGEGISFTWLDKKLPLAQKLDHKAGVNADLEEFNKDVCLEGTSHCQDDETCCSKSDTELGCCPHSKGVCCSDGTHCCPEGTTCSVSMKKCIKVEMTTGRQQTIISIDFVTLKSPPDLPKAGDVVCPDGQSECPDGYTCCLMVSGQYGCCPLPDAVCCADRIHCCPQYTICNLTAQTCQGAYPGIPDQSFSIIWPKSSAKNLQTRAEDVICPDQKHACPDESTCCKTPQGFGCCPGIKAVCCSDGAHCCPEGTTCDLDAGTCVHHQRLSGSVPWLEKMPAVREMRDTFKCNGSSKECNMGDTCCMTAAGNMGCCPLPDAVCCSDGTHCCPGGTICDVESGRCLKQEGHSVSWSTKSLIQPVLNDVICPDKSRCPNGATCCVLTSGAFGCCPLPKAVCCADHEHCCPANTKCDTKQGKCIKQGRTTSLQTVSPAASRYNHVVCRDGKHECPDGSTCWEASTGSFECCPIPKAICCSDGIHCCPQGYTCDVAEGRCKQSDGYSLAWSEKIPARSRETPDEDSHHSEDDNSVQEKKCPDESSCPDKTTCCPLNTGGYGCCPVENAVCCPDKLHCCPNGFKCEAGTGNCIKGESKFPFSHRLTP